jgi:hypothetical protein
MGQPKFERVTPAIGRLRFTRAGYARAFHKMGRAESVRTQSSVISNYAKFTEVYAEGAVYRKSNRGDTFYITQCKMARNLEDRKKLLSLMKRSMDGERIQLVICTRDVIEPYYDEAYTAFCGNVLILDEV